MKRFSQGLAEKKGFTIEDADPKELEIGCQMELEHTSDPKVAEQTALDHLCEYGNYYTELKKMEDRLKKQKSAIHAYYRFLLKGNR